MPPSHLEQRAKAFAEFYHRDQRRKYMNEPYTNHRNIANLMKSVEWHTQEMVVVAWLHDVLEDTSASYEKVRGAFGQDVADMVRMLTDISRPEDGNRRVRKEIDRFHISVATPEAKTVKIADLIDNVRDIVKNDPKFAVVFLDEAIMLLDVLGDGDVYLYDELSKVINWGLGEIRT
jgi:(p)ppGpp synthase/HD superfamily hydrolase